ncbi:MAG TPA: ATP-binding protein [Acholeplasmatales bacterium]|jgi:predicted ATPase (AAA+ superfamily)|nr:ATP-binding protein [Bacilli bacterium]CDC68882.1 predicted ATPase (AAA+ superfamily) [Staphylococcus sp. CAG:324]HAR58456.1 ATP-binding protein [Acholeplasmatales bacterium]
MNLYKREEYLKRIRGFYHDTEIIKVISGVRRCGKSSLMLTIKQELLDSGISEENCIFIDLDSRKYNKIKTDQDLEDLLESYSNIRGTKYIFIDEIQNIKNFEEVINAFRTDGEYSIFITGSNSYLLSGELVTKLTGRYIEFEIFTLSFYEYIEMKKYYNKQVDSNIINELNNYIIEGGFPKTIQYDSIIDKRSYTNAVVEEIFEKDIKKRVKVRTVETFNLVKNFIINNYGQTMSVLSIQKGLENVGIKVRRETITKYIDILVSAKIIYQCDRFDMKSKRALKGEKKYYLADSSFYYAINTDNRINYGPALENVIYTYARSKKYTVSVGRIGLLECDFILRDDYLNYSYIQIAYTILESKKTEDREYSSLELIKDNYPKYVLTTDFLIQKRNGIVHANIASFINNNLMF